MSKGLEIRCYDYVNHPYEKVRDALKRDALDVFQSASKAAASRAQSVAAALHVDLGGIGVKADIKIPIIFMTGHGDIPMTVRAMKAGAIEFLPKPFRDQDMLDAVQLALERDRARRQAELANAQLLTNFESLSPREREVMALVTAGLMNKNIAAQLGLAEVTVKFHRGSLMRKMNARSVAELAKMAQILGITRQLS